jgi:hypothetical protein
MKKNGVPWQEVPDSNCERRISPLKCAAAAVRITEQAQSRLEQDRTATADSGTRQRVRSTARLAFSVVS